MAESAIKVTIITETDFIDMIKNQRARVAEQEQNQEPDESYRKGYAKASEDIVDDILEILQQRKEQTK